MTKHYEKHKQRVREGASKDFIITESGYKGYDVKAGYLTADDLRIIADYLDELNSDWDDNIIHGQLNQCVAATGRLSASKPNQQNFAGDTLDIFESRYD